MKTTSNIFYQIFIVTIVLVTCLISLSTSEYTTSSSLSACNCSTYNRSYRNVLSRKKRFLIFPKGANIINTSYFGKQIVAGFPTGFNWILELDIFWPLPFMPRVFSQAKDLLFGKNKPKVNIPPWLNEPKKPSYSTYAAFLSGPTKPVPPPTPPMMPAEIIHSKPDHFKWEHDHPGEIYMPASGWKDDVIANIKSQIDIKHKSWDPYNVSGYNTDPNTWLNHNFVDSSVDSSRNYYYPQGRALNDGLDSNSDVNYDYIDQHPRWKNIYAQKDRQELYDIIHAGFKKIGIDTTACLQRTICEVKHFLLPQGKSLLHDVFRVFFSYPMHMNDKYGEAARTENEEDCNRIYGQECPMSILDFIFHSGKVF